jgi:VanZ family protein
MVLNWLRKNNHISWLITILLAVFIFIMSSIDFSSTIPSGGFSWKSMTYHFSAFFIFSFFLFHSSYFQNNKNKNIVLGLVIAMAYAILDEVHQIFVPGRFYSIFDIFTDWVGVFFAYIIFLLFFRSK